LPFRHYDEQAAVQRTPRLAFVSAGRVAAVGFTVVRPEELQFETRPHEPGEAPRHAAAVTELAGFRHTRANFFRFEPGAKGRRHVDRVQEETYMPVRGTLTMYLGEPPDRREVPVGGLVHVEPGTARQIVNEGDENLLVYIYGSPPERGETEFLDSVV
jgi:mannose-6-phosphate isomerase-like protein (cupin superfamily)